MGTSILLATEQLEQGGARRTFGFGMGPREGTFLSIPPLSNPRFGRRRQSTTTEQLHGKSRYDGPHCWEFAGYHRRATEYGPNPCLESKVSPLDGNKIAKATGKPARGRGLVRIPFP